MYTLDLTLLDSAQVHSLLAVNSITSQILVQQYPLACAVLIDYYRKIKEENEQFTFSYQALIEAVKDHALYETEQERSSLKDIVCCIDSDHAELLFSKKLLANLDIELALLPLSINIGLIKRLFDTIVTSDQLLRDDEINAARIYFRMSVHDRNQNFKEVFELFLKTLEDIATFQKVQLIPTMMFIMTSVQNGLEFKQRIKLLQDYMIARPDVFSEQIKKIIKDCFLEGLESNASTLDLDAALGKDLFASYYLTITAKEYSFARIRSYFNSLKKIQKYIDGFIDFSEKSWSSGLLGPIAPGDSPISLYENLGRGAYWAQPVWHYFGMKAAEKVVLNAANRHLQGKAFIYWLKSSINFRGLVQFSPQGWGFYLTVEAIGLLYNQKERIAYHLNKVGGVDSYSVVKQEFRQRWTDRALAWLNKIEQQKNPITAEDYSDNSVDLNASSILYKAPNLIFKEPTEESTQDIAKSIEDQIDAVRSQIGRFICLSTPMVTFAEYEAKQNKSSLQQLYLQVKQEETVFDFAYKHLDKADMSNTLIKNIKEFCGK